MRSESFSAITNLIRDSLQKGLIHLFSANFLTQLLGFGSLLFVSKLLTPLELGAIKIIQSYIAVCVTFATLGHTTAIIKFCAEMKSVDLRGYVLKKSVITTVFSGTVIAAAVIALSNEGFLTPDDTVKKYLPPYASVIILNVLYAVFTTYMQACKDFKNMAKIQIGLKTLSFFAVVIATYTDGLDGYVIAVISTAFLALVPIVREIGPGFVFYRRQTMPAGFYFLVKVSIVSSSVGMLGSTIDMFFLDHYVTNREAIGFYSLATMFLLVATQFTGTVQAFLTPYFSERSRDGYWLWRNMKKYQACLAVAIVPICFVIFAAAWVLVKIYYGESYEVMLSFLVCLLFKTALHSVYAVLGIGLLSLNKVQYNCAVAVFYLFLKSTLCYWLVGHYGIWGIVAAQVLTEIPTVILHYFVTYRVFCTHFGRGNF